MEYMRALSDLEATDENKALIFLSFFDVIEEVDCEVEVLSTERPICAVGIHQHPLAQTT